MEVVVLSVTESEDDGNGVCESCLVLAWPLKQTQAVTHELLMDSFQSNELGICRKGPLAWPLELHLLEASHRSSQLSAYGLHLVQRQYPAYCQHFSFRVLLVPPSCFFRYAVHGIVDLIIPRSNVQHLQLVRPPAVQLAFLFTMDFDFLRIVP